MNLKDFLDLKYQIDKEYHYYLYAFRPEAQHLLEKYHKIKWALEEFTEKAIAEKLEKEHIEKEDFLKRGEE